MIVDSILKFKVWFFLGNKEIKARYKRSIIGPLWITLGTLLVLMVIGPVYGILLGQNSDQYIVYLACGLIYWILFASTLNSCCQSLINSASTIASRNVPALIFVLKDIYRELIIFLHNLPLIMIVYFYNVFYLDNEIIYINFILIFISLVLTIFFLFCLGSLIAIFCLRYRDLISLIANLVTILFFVTPVIWSPGLIGKNFDWLEFNIANKLLKIFRDPILGYNIDLSLYLEVLLYDVGLLIVLILVVRKVKNKLVFWI
mgnify:CR=1 FL=1